jgi:hypothetical protein
VTFIFTFTLSTNEYSNISAEFDAPHLPPHLYKSGGKVKNDWVIDFTPYSLILNSREVRNVRKVLDV